MSSNKWQVASGKWRIERITHYAFRFAFYTLIGLLLFSLALPVLAQDGAEDDDNGLKKAVTADDVNKIARVVYCPVCESTPLDVCQTQACADWREIIRDMLAEGKSEQEIFDYFSNLYGPRVLAEPPTKGFSLLVWVLPLVLIPIGVIFFSRYLRNLRAEDISSGAESAVSAPPATDSYLSQIEKELEDH